MSDSPDPGRNEQEDLSKSGQRAYSAAIRTSVIGGIISFSFAVLAVSTLLDNHSDSAGLGFYVFGFLAIAVFMTSGFIAILISLAGVINYATTLNQNNESKEATINGIVKSVSLILAMILALLVAFKLLKIVL